MIAMADDDVTVCPLCGELLDNVGDACAACAVAEEEPA
jgi:hypothetical protein